MTGIFGTLISRGQVDAGVLSTLSTPPAGSGYPLLAYYLAEVERQLGLDAQTLPLPPGPSSYRSEVDFDTFQAEWLPLVGSYSQPTGTTERHEGGEYGQWYETRVAAIVGDDDEDRARMIADAYGIAIAGALLQNGSLGGVSQRTVMAGAADIAYIDPAVRQVSRATLTLHVYVQPVVLDTGGRPSGTWPANPYTQPTGYGDVQTVDVTVSGITDLP